MSPDPEKWSPPLIAVVGIGTGVRTASMEALRWIQRAEVLVGGIRHLDFFPDHPGEKIPIRGPLEAVLDVVDAASAQRRVAVLASGDPLFFGIGRSLSARFSRDRLHFIPGPTSVQTLCAALGRSWDDVQVFSLHGRTPSLAWMWFLRRGHALAFLTDKEHPPRWIAARLHQAGFEDPSVYVGEDLGLPSERISVWTPEEASGKDFSPLNVVLVTPPQSALRENPADAKTFTPSAWPLGEARPGVDDAAFLHREGLITKKEVRSVALSLLRLAPGHVLWDLGAGSGAVSVEAALLCPLRSVWAVEKVWERAADIRANARRFRCGEIQVVVDDALQAVSSLPAPDRVFVGGSGGTLSPLLHAVWARVAPSGRVVISAVTVHTLAELEAFAALEKVRLETVQVQVSRGVPIGSSLRFEALNPVFLCAMEKAAP
uniref:Precorrin-6y C5,15-methyltransferase (Decarboxylating) subunit CbiE n=1 Tax=Desulfacinum infernum TaxID=35837 RepID=A0A832A0Y8_9BACT